MRFNDNESRAILLFEEWYLRPDAVAAIDFPAVYVRLELPEQDYIVVMDRLVSLKAIEDESTLEVPRLHRFKILPAIRDLAEEVREAKSKAPADLVDQIVAKARSHPRLAWFIVGAIALAFALTIVNGIFDLVQNLRENWPAKADRNPPAKGTAK